MGQYPKIGVYSDSYPDKRLILDKVPQCEYIQVDNKQELLARVFRFAGRKWKDFTQTDTYAQKVHFTLDADAYPNVDLIHTFNRVCLRDNNKWVSTFERTLPEYFSEERAVNLETMRRQLPLLLSEKCLALLPISKWAYEYEMAFLAQFASQNDLQNIRNKMAVLYPPQDVLATREEVVEKYENLSTIRFFFVGGQLKRKGGFEVLKVFQKLRKEYDNFSVTMVGDPNNNYKNFYLSEGEKRELSQLLSSSDWLDFHTKLPNEEVLKHIKKAHVGLLPSMGDTFGFSVLEMQAGGCPVITTDREALPEINDLGCGWLLDTSTVKQTHGDDFAYYTKQEVDNLSEIIQEKMIITIRTILDNPSVMEKKALNSLRRIKEAHKPGQYAAKLLDIYRSANI